MSQHATLKADQKVARLARRSAASEATLILTAGFAAIMVLLFVFGDRTFLPLAELTGVRPTILWIGLSFAVSLLLAILHKRRMAPKIAQAQAEVAARIYEEQNARRAETEAKMAAMKGSET